MALIIYCAQCSAELSTPGGLLLGSLDKHGQGDKDHLCARCYQQFKQQVTYAGQQHCGACRRALANGATAARLVSPPDATSRSAMLLLCEDCHIILQLRLPYR